MPLMMIRPMKIMLRKLLRHTVILLLTASLKVHVDEVHVKCGGGGGDGARLTSVHVL